MVAPLLAQLLQRSQGQAHLAGTHGLERLGSQDLPLKYEMGENLKLERIYSSNVIIENGLDPLFWQMTLADLSPL